VPSSNKREWVNVQMGDMLPVKKQGKKSFDTGRHCYVIWGKRKSYVVGDRTVRQGIAEFLPAVYSNYSAICNCSAAIWNANFDWGFRPPNFFLPMEDQGSCLILFRPPNFFLVGLSTIPSRQTYTGIFPSQFSTSCGARHNKPRPLLPPSE